MNSLKHFKRSNSDRMLAGICGALADVTPIPSFAYRIGLFFLMFIGAPFVIPMYFVAWFVIPSEEEESTAYVVKNHQSDGINLDREFNSLDKNLNLIEKKLARLEDLAIKRKSFR